MLQGVDVKWYRADKAARGFEEVLREVFPRGWGVEEAVPSFEEILGRAMRGEVR